MEYIYITYKNIRSVCCTPETNIVCKPGICQLKINKRYLQKKKKKDTFRFLLKEDVEWYYALQQSCDDSFYKPQRPP